MSRPYGKDAVTFTMPQLEIAAVTLEDAIRAQKGGADSIEVSHDLSVGGLSPDFELVQRIRDAVTLDLHVMIRPRVGNFHYNAHEIDVILDQARRLAQTGIDGVVFGAVDVNGRIDEALIQQVANAAQPKIVTLHRALDYSVEPAAALERLAGVIPRVLTGGPAATAYEARDTLAAWVRAFGKRFTFVISGGLKLAQMPEMLAQVNAQAYHFGSAARVDGAVDVAKVRALVEQLKVTS